MGDDQGGHAVFHQVLDHRQHLPHHLRVKGGGGLIKQHHLRVHGQGPHNGQALLLAAGQAPWMLLRLFQQSHPGQQLLSIGLGFLLAPLFEHYRGQGDVLQHRQVGKHIEMLEHHAHLLPVQVHIDALLRQVHPLEDHLAGAGLLQQVKAAQKGGFAGAGGPDDGHHLALVEGFAHLMQHHQVAKAFAQIHCANHWSSASSHIPRSAC